MKTTVKKLLAAAALVLTAPLASASVLNFDDLTGFGPMTTYGGLTFSDWYHYDKESPPYNAASGRTSLFDTTNSNSFGRVSAFTFQGASFAGATGVNVRFDMFLNGAYVFSSTTLSVDDKPTFLGSGYTGLVDSVKVTSGNPQYFVMDDLTFNEASNVPEPGSLALLFGAMGVMGVMARRRKA